MQINTLSADDRRALGLERSGADIDAAVRGYIEAQLWTTQDESLDNGTLTNDGAMMDARLSFDDVYENYRSAVREELEHYIAEHPLAYRLYCAQRAHDLSAEEIGAYFGHDFYLTREHHGVGFWDRDYRRTDGTYDGAIGEFWTSVAQSAGGADHLDGHVPAREVPCKDTEEQEPATTGALEEMLEHVGPFVLSAVMSDQGTHALVVTDDAVEWKLEVNDPDPSTHGTVSLWNDMRALSFTGWDELRGWLRCYRSMKS